MNLKNFNDLTELLKRKAIEQNKSYQDDIIKEHYELEILPNLILEKKEKILQSNEYKKFKENYLSNCNNLFPDPSSEYLKEIDFTQKENDLKSFISKEIRFKIINEITLNKSPQYNDVMEFLENDFIVLPIQKENDLKTLKFKDDLVSFYNSYFTNLFNDFGMKDFYLLKDIITTHLELRYQRFNHNFPFQDKQKYNKRINTLNKKMRYYLTPKLQPYKRIKFFQHKAKELINPKALTFTYINNTRDFNKCKNEMILELTNIISNHSYQKEIKDKSNMRLTPNTLSMYNTELKHFKKTINNKSIKKYTLKPQCFKINK